MYIMEIKLYSLFGIISKLDKKVNHIISLSFISLKDRDDKYYEST
ncbi:protein of unknown function [Candidatus Nitrosocosmicus franklandus]|uniref:Uncharacterized protein n=1 Tax=Candidatus Nitrosocosmicus franklandianus TaxID=1798806 RepID=A0A484I892_9ARCH|nr:protein of unknown function [Candidatus Nitrosocosmicus franklandus]